MSRVEDIHREAFRTHDLDVGAAWKRKALAWSRKLDEEQMEHAATRIALRCTGGQVRLLEQALRDVENGRLAALRFAEQQKVDLGEAHTRIAELEAEVAALRDADTVDVPPVDSPVADVGQYPRVVWSGGECPLPGVVGVYIWRRNGWTDDEDGDPQTAAGYRWGHPARIDVDDILAYRIAPDSEQTPEGLAALREYLRTHEPDGTPRATPGGEE